MEKSYQLWTYASFWGLENSLFAYFVNHFSSVAQSCLTLWPHESQHARPPCPSPTPGVHSDSCPSSRWCHPAISSSVIPFTSPPKSLPASESFPMSQLFAQGGQNIGVSASTSVLPMNTQDWSLLGWTGWISLQSKELSRVFSNTTVQKHQFFSAQLSSQSNTYIVAYIFKIIMHFITWINKNAMIKICMHTVWNVQRMKLLSSLASQ